MSGMQVSLAQHRTRAAPALCTPVRQPGVIKSAHFQPSKAQRKKLLSPFHAPLCGDMALAAVLAFTHQMETPQPLCATPY
jgi:hypothetical protein